MRFKARMHHIRFRLGLSPRPHWKSLQRSPDPLDALKGPTSKGGKGGEGKEGRGGEGEGLALIETSNDAPADVRSVTSKSTHWNPLSAPLASELKDIQIKFRYKR